MYISETEEELFSDDGKVSRKPGRSYQVTNKKIPVRGTAVRQLPGLSQQTGNGLTSSREELTDQKQGEGEPPNPPSPVGARDNPGDDDSHASITKWW
jgi:hypothetical protein